MTQKNNVKTILKIKKNVMKLIPMSDYALEQYSIKQSNYKFWKKIGKYANFLKQDITLKMLVPCDEKGREIIIDTEHREDSTSWSPDEIERYKKAETEIYLKTIIDLDTAKFHVKQKRTIEYFTSFEIEISEYAVKKFQLEP